MPNPDALRWNERYLKEERYAHFDQPRPFLVEHADLLPERGLALDVAMGLGGNAAFLLQRGLRVVGVDISAVAMRYAKARFPELMAVVADLNHFYLPEATFDLILNFFYLQRDLWPRYRSALRPGGILVIETLTREFLSLHPETDPTYLLAPGELREAFHEWEIRVYREGWSESRQGHQRATAALIARRPGWIT